MERKEFIEKYDPTIQALAKQYKLFPEIVYAQAFIEGGDSKGKFGESYTMKHGNNIFNIRPGSSWKGETISNPWVKSESKIFRKYDSLEDSIEDYFKFLASNKRYREAGVFSAPTIAAQAEALQKAGYAGKSTTYAKLITDLSNGVRKLMGKAPLVVKNVKDNWYWYAVGTAVVVGGAYVYRKKLLK